jgi:hypothetical protein
MRVTDIFQFGKKEDGHGGHWVATVGAATVTAGAATAPRPVGTATATGAAAAARGSPIVGGGFTPFERGRITAHSRPQD